MGPQCFGCQGYSHMKSECPTYLKSKGKTMVVTLSNGEVSDDESKCDEDGNCWFLDPLKQNWINLGI